MNTPILLMEIAQLIINDKLTCKQSTMSIHNRIATVLKIKNRRYSYIAKKAGIEEADIHHFMTGKVSPTVDFVQFLLKEHPQLNLKWLFLGSGEMMEKDELTTSTDETLKDMQNRLDTLSNMYQKLEENYIDILSKIELDRTEITNPELQKIDNEITQLWDFVYPPKLMRKLYQYFKTYPEALEVIKNEESQGFKEFINKVKNIDKELTKKTKHKKVKMN